MLTVYSPVSGSSPLQSFAPSAPSGDALADGEKSWSGELPESGNYRIHIGTDATANYTLEVTIR